MTCTQCGQTYGLVAWGHNHLCAACAARYIGIMADRVHDSERYAQEAAAVSKVLSKALAKIRAGMDRPVPNLGPRDVVKICNAALDVLGRGNREDDPA